MSQHLVLDNWRETAREARRLGREYGLELLAMEQPRQDPDMMEKAFQAANEAGIPVVNCGPGGKSDDEEPSSRASTPSVASPTGPKNTVSPSASKPMWAQPSTTPRPPCP